MLERYRDYAQSNPLPSWLIEVTFLLTVNLAMFWFVPGPKKVGLLLLFVVFALSPPTRGLMRFSEEQRRVRPVPPRQEEGVGLLSLSALGASFGALGVATFGKHLGLFLPHNSLLLLLMLFSVSTLLSLALGYAARRTPDAGRALGAAAVCNVADSPRWGRVRGAALAPHLTDK